VTEGVYGMRTLNRLVTLIILVILTCGCQARPINQNEDIEQKAPVVNSSKMHIGGVETDVKIDIKTDEPNKEYKNFWELHMYKNEKFQENVPRFLEEFKQSLEMYESKKSNFNLVNAIIRGSVFSAGQLDDEDTVLWIEEKRQYLSEQLDHFSVVYSGTSTEGVQFVAILTPDLSNSIEGYGKAIGQLRGDEQELSLMTDIGVSPGPDDYFAVDIFPRDLMNIYEEIEIIDMHLTDEHKKRIPYISSRPQSEYLENLLKKYDRDINVSTIMKRNDWNLYLFNDPVTVPKSLVIKYKAFTNTNDTITLTPTSN
jgi:hypothetical protein